MSSKQGPAHVVVDGSNIATEGRSMPSLAQLSEAVGSFMEEYPDTAITVVVDATFGHRIDKSEVDEFEAGISNNELVAPPAGAVGRGDAFVLSIAHKVGASILSNDSFQEFHGEYQWLFDDGRLVGGKPVPHIGWVFVDRVPVRGPVSRKATRGSGSSGRGRGRDRGRSGRDDDSSVRQGSKEASSPMPTPKSPPPSSSSKKTAAKKTAAKKGASKKNASKQTTPEKDAPKSTSKRAPKGGEPVNELMPFLDFVEHHPVGTSVTGTVDAYSSHGAYVMIGDTDVRGYVPLNMMADPAPRSAKKIMKQGESLTLVVVSFAPGRRSIDCALPEMAESAIAEAAANAATDDDGEVAMPASAKKTPAKKTAAKKTATKKTAAKKASAKQVAAKKSAAKKSAATKTAAKKATAKHAATKKTAAKKTTANKAPAKNAATTRAAAKQPAAKKTTAAKKTAAKTAAKKAPAKKTAAANKAPAKRPARKKAAQKKTQN